MAILRTKASFTRGTTWFLKAIVWGMIDASSGPDQVSEMVFDILDKLA